MAGGRKVRKEFRRGGGRVGGVGETVTSLCEGVCNRLWEGDAVVGSNGRPIGEGHRVEIGEVIRPRDAAATRPTVIALGSLAVRGEGMPPGELKEK